MNRSEIKSFQENYLKVISKPRRLMKAITEGDKYKTSQAVLALSGGLLVSPVITNTCGKNQDRKKDQGTMAIWCVTTALSAPPFLTLHQGSTTSSTNLK